MKVSVVRSYAFNTYWCAYLLVHHQKEFLAALINASSDTKDKLLRAINTCKAMEVDVLPPSIYKLSESTIVDDGHIRLGTSACKFLKKGAKSLIKAVEKVKRKKSLNIYNLFKYLDKTKYNISKAKSIVKSGALDTLAVQEGMTRTGLVHALDYIYDHFRTSMKKIEQHQKWEERKAKRAEQEDLKARGEDYGGRLVGVGKEPELPEFSLDEFRAEHYPSDKLQELLDEYEVLSICLTGDPLDYLVLPKNRKLIDNLENTAPVRYNHKNAVNVAGIVSGFKTAGSGGQTRASFMLEDGSSVAVVNIPHRLYGKTREKLEDGTCISAVVVPYKSDGKTLRLSVKSYERLEPAKEINVKQDLDLVGLKVLLAKPDVPLPVKMGNIKLDVIKGK